MYSIIIFIKYYLVYIGRYAIINFIKREQKAAIFWQLPVIVVIHCAQLMDERSIFRKVAMYILHDVSDVQSCLNAWNLSSETENAHKLPSLVEEAIEIAKFLCNTTVFKTLSLCSILNEPAKSP